MGFSVRQLTPEDFEVSKHLRLLALKSDPSSFSSTYEDELTRTDAEWQEELDHPRKGFFALFDGQKTIGFTAISIIKNDPKTAKLWGTWLDSDYRGKKLSDYFYEARVAWAQKHPTVERIVIAHLSHNVASRAAILRNGFQFTHEDKLPNGETDLWYELWVKPKVMER